MTPMTRVFLGIIGTAGLLVTLPCIASMVHELATSQPDPSVNILIIAAMSVLALPSMFAVYKAFKSPPVITTTLQNEENTERLVLQMARIRNGRVSPTHVAMQTPLTIEQATQMLKELELRGVVYSEVTVHGGTEFVFPDLLQPTTDFDQFDNALAEQKHVLDLDSAQPKAHETQSIDQTIDRA